MGCFFFLRFLFLSLSELPRLDSALGFLELGVNAPGEDVRFRGHAESEGVTRRVGVDAVGVECLSMVVLTVTRCSLIEQIHVTETVGDYCYSSPPHTASECRSTSLSTPPSDPPFTAQERPASRVAFRPVSQRLIQSTCLMLTQSPSPPPKQHMTFFPSLLSLHHPAHTYAPVLPWPS
jgi:hypothetical protein